MDFTEQNKLENPELIDSALKTSETPAEIDYSKVDYSKLDPSKLPHHLVQMTPAFQGVLREVQDNRDKVKELSDNNELLTAELQKRDEAEEKDPDEPVTRGEMVSTMREIITDVFSKQETARKKEEKTRADQDAVKRLNESCLKLENEYTEDKTGKGLDAKTVITEGLHWLAVHEPELLAAARQSSDPARKIYKLAITHVPQLIERFEAHKNSQFLETIQQGRIPKGGGTIPSGQEKSELIRILEMPEDELFAAIRQEELS